MDKIPERLNLPTSQDIDAIKRKLTESWLNMAQLVNNVFTLYAQATMPTIPTNTTALWQDTSTTPDEYYLVSNFGGEHKLIQLTDALPIDPNHKHSKLWASDGNPETVTVDASVNMSLGVVYYDDLPPSPILAARLGATAPTLATFVSGTEQYTFDATNDYVIGATEVTHGYKEGTNIVAHIHWATNGTDVADKGVQWQLEYTVSNSDESAPFASAFGATGTMAIDTVIPAATADRSHILSVFAPAITGTSVKIGAYIAWKLSRIASATAAPSANPFALAVGFHVQMDTLGSRTASAK
jgi:hypothetical protein